MPKYLLPEDGVDLEPFWWAPLEAVARVASQSPDPDHHLFDVADFMLMCCIDRGRQRPRIYLYKHYYTRWYINVDDGGHAYRYIPPPPNAPDSNHGRYVRHRDLRKALDHLRLWRLPNMKPSLRPVATSYPWDDESWDGETWDDEDETADATSDDPPPGAA